jgi:anti-sigma B factor antagonist
MRPFDTSTGIIGGVSVLRVSGDLDAADASILSLALISATASTGRVVVDLSECDFIDSAGIAAIVEAWRGPDGPESRGRLVLAGASDQVDRIIRITGLDESIAIFDGIDEALAALAPDEPVAELDPG